MSLAPIGTVAPPLRRLAAVPTDPPFEDERGEGLLPGAGQPMLPISMDVPRHPTQLRLVPPLAPDDRADFFGPQRTSRRDLPDPATRAAVIVRALLEVLAGDRPVRQLTHCLAPALAADLEQRRRRVGAGRPWAASVRSLRVSEPADGIAEVTVVLVTPERHRALALRLEGVDGSWRATALQVG